MKRILYLLWLLMPLALFGQGVGVRSQNGLATNLTVRTGELIDVNAHGATNLWWLTNVFAINSATSRVDWTQLKNVPVDIADGTDDTVAGAAVAFTNAYVAWGDQYRTNWLAVGTTGTTNTGKLYLTDELVLGSDTTAEGGLKMWDGDDGAYFSLRTQSEGFVTTNDFTANRLFGDGAGLYNLNPGDFTSGSITGSLTGTFIGDGSGLTNLYSLWWTNAAAADSISNNFNVRAYGLTISDGGITANVADTTLADVYAENISATTLAGSGSGITSINPTNISSGYTSGLSIGGNAASATTASTANAGDTATAFFPSGTIEPARLATNTPSAALILKATSATTAAWDTESAGGPTNLVNNGSDVLLTNTNGYTGLSLGGIINSIKYPGAGYPNNALYVDSQAQRTRLFSMDDLVWVEANSTNGITLHATNTTVSGNLTVIGGATFDSLTMTTATFTNAIFASNSLPAYATNGFVVWNPDNAGLPKIAYYGNGGTPTITNTLALSGRSPTNTWGGAVVDFTRGEQVHTNLAGDLTITGIVGFVNDKDNWQIVDMDANGGDRVIAVPAAWYVSGFTNATTVTVTNGTWAELCISAIIGRRTNAVINMYQ